MGKGIGAEWLSVRGDRSSGREGQAARRFLYILHRRAIQRGMADSGKADNPVCIDNEVSSELVSVGSGAGRGMREKMDPEIIENGAGRPGFEAVSIHPEGGIESFFRIQEQGIAHTGFLAPPLPPEWAVFEGDVRHPDPEVGKKFILAANPRRMLSAGESPQMPEKNQKQPPSPGKDSGSDSSLTQVGGREDAVDAVADGSSHGIFSYPESGAGDVFPPRRYDHNLVPFYLPG